MLFSLRLSHIFKYKPERSSATEETQCTRHDLKENWILKLLSFTQDQKMQIYLLFAVRSLTSKEISVSQWIVCLTPIQR